MGYKSSQADYEKQAELIARAIKECPSSWHGVIHVTRKTESTYLAQRLARRGLGHRVWTPEYTDSTNIQMQKWEIEKRRNKGVGKIAIVWTWMEGVDLREERICITAKVPFPGLGDDYERARMTYSGRSYQWRTATQLEQAMGRTRRGEREDYDLDGKRNQLVCIADGNWTRVKNSLSQDFLDAIVRL